MDFLESAARHNLIAKKLLTESLNEFGDNKQRLINAAQIHLNEAHRLDKTYRLPSIQKQLDEVALPKITDRQTFNPREELEKGEYFLIVETRFTNKRNLYLAFVDDIKQDSFTFIETHVLQSGIFKEIGTPITGEFGFDQIKQTGSKRRITDKQSLTTRFKVELVSK